MTGTKIRLLRAALAAIVGLGCLFISENVLLIKSGSLITEAQAVIGRPLTPMSYAGVARRTTRRAVGAGAVYGAPVVVVAPAPVVVAPRCVQAVDAYGRIYMRCY
jgi:hypothetical protein